MHGHGIFRNPLHPLQVEKKRIPDKSPPYVAKVSCNGCSGSQATPELTLRGQAMTNSVSVATEFRSPAESTPWLTVSEAADRARCGVKTIYREVRAGRLRAARIGGRRELRLLAEWVDAWLVDHSTVVLTRPLR